jgi:hypothetical protein
MKQSKKTLKTTCGLLEQRLKNAGINISKWGTGQTKTLEHFQKEIEKGESILATDTKGKLLRKVMVVSADVHHISADSRKFVLKEDKQVFKDGRVRRRNLMSVSEKMKPAENSKEAMIRGIQEELGIDSKIILEEKEIEKQTIESPSYPGLLSQYINHKFKVSLNDKQFNKNGYIENDGGIITYFTWIEIK